MGYITDLDLHPQQQITGFTADNAQFLSSCDCLDYGGSEGGLRPVLRSAFGEGGSPNPIHGPSTPLVPVAIAIAVWEEASELLDTALPRSWIRQLTRRADAVCLHNPEFRARVYAAAGNAGRDYLWTFMRHWISGLLFQHDPSLAAQLPAGYNVGHVRRS